MANIIRSAKSASDWTSNELTGYHITVSLVTPENFFQNNAAPSLEHIEPAILTSAPNTILDDPEKEEANKYLGYLDLATGTGQESAIDNFALETLRLLKFEETNTLLATRRMTNFTICGEKKSAQTDVALLKRPDWILLVLVENKTLANPTNAEAQVVAEAIAAFQFNNEKRKEKKKPELEKMIIPCVTMSGTRPTFYLVPVTAALSTAIKTGQYPAAETVVQKCDIKPTHTRNFSDGVGMDNLVYRKLALERFLAFKALAKSHWNEFIAGM